MAGPNIVVRVLGDLKGLGDNFKAATSVAGDAASKIHGAFSDMLGTLNRTGVLGPFGEALAGIDQAIGKVLEHGKNIGAAMLGVGGALVGVGAGLQALGSKDKAAHQQLQASVEATGASYEEYAGRVESAIKGQEKYGTTADKTQDALRKLTDATHDPGRALDLLGQTADLAASKHLDLSDAADKVGKVANGNTKLLKPYGIAIDTTTGLTKDGKTALEALADVTKGQASAATDTFTGKLSALKAHLEDSTSAFAQKYGPAITAGGAALAALGGITETATAINDAFAASEALSLGPILAIVAAVVLLGATIYLVYRNWDTIWSAMQAAAAAVFGWIKTNWPLLLAILTGPIGLAALEIARHWSAITAAASRAIADLRGGWDAFIGFFTGLPGRISSAASGMFDGIWQAFRAAINHIIEGWNGLHFGIPEIDTHIPGVGKVGGGSFGVPQIPRLAQGGLITKTGLIYAHAGEAVTPAPAPTRAGPAVVINDAHFETELDVDAFMKRAAWVAQTAGL